MAFSAVDWLCDTWEAIRFVRQSGLHKLRENSFGFLALVEYCRRYGEIRFAGNTRRTVELLTGLLQFLPEDQQVAITLHGCAGWLLEKIPTTLHFAPPPRSHMRQVSGALDCNEISVTWGLNPATSRAATQTRRRSKDIVVQLGQEKRVAERTGQVLDDLSTRLKVLQAQARLILLRNALIRQVVPVRLTQSESYDGPRSQVVW